MPAMGFADYPELSPLYQKWHATALKTKRHKDAFRLCIMNMLHEAYLEGMDAQRRSIKSKIERVLGL